jgi:hypothetical protein
MELVKCKVKKWGKYAFYEEKSLEEQLAPGIEI